MNDAAIHAEEPYEEEEAEVVLSEVLARNLDMPEGCIWASRYEEAFKKGVILTLPGGVDLRITPTLNWEGLPELAISCCTLDDLKDLYSGAGEWASEENGMFTSFPSERKPPFLRVTGRRPWKRENCLQTEIPCFPFYQVKKHFATRIFVVEECRITVEI